MESGENQILELVEKGLSATEALDYFFVEEQGWTLQKTADARNVTHQTVSRNVRNAHAKLEANSADETTENISKTDQ